MRRILLSIIIIGVVAGMMGAGTFSYFSDVETSSGNTFTAGVLDLKVGDNDPCCWSFSIGPMIPGQTYFSGFVNVTNMGNIPGNLTVNITNLFCHENGLEEPEIAAGDSANTQLDPDGFSQEGGYGELWDQVMFSLVIDDGDGVRDWQDTTMYLYPDESSYYSIPVNTPIVLDNNFTAGETLGFGVEVKFIDDSWTSYSWILDGIPNNAAMGDSVSMDLVFKLEQI